MNKSYVNMNKDFIIQQHTNMDSDKILKI
jgi:hypothetical protein